ncbi:amidase [Ruegeria sp. 2205SS24-7]|uniref:amidase n=1 Tax=Ruegeria discodermiae TaxID=3064389 RepID=UPI00274035ED|nr:amidase [Ruegeria sp. 2205SS24-7]MDP5220582.1 amidase [Ruegeria sp. 2205SS24-7]
MTPHWRETEWADGIEKFAERLRSGEDTALAATERALQRIATHDEQMQAFVHVAAEAALEQASRCDALLADGQDLGPLMGIPVGVKDLFAVDGMPTRAGSRLDVSHAIGPQGPFIDRLQAAGAVILGKCRTIEFAAGAQNVSHPTPWNPADPVRQRSPGGSSNGSAIAVAAGYCPLSIGSDTGGSVRAPASLCGLTGHKFTAGSVSLEGVFPLCARLDSPGIFTVNCRDAQLAYDCLNGGQGGADRVEVSLDTCRLGKPHDDFFRGLESEVAEAYTAALSRLAGAGAKIVSLDWPNRDEIALISQVFAGLIPAELTTTLGAELIAVEADQIDPVAMHRLGPGRIVADGDIGSLTVFLGRLVTDVQERMQDLAGLVYPTTPVTAPLVEDVLTPATAVSFTGQVLSLTRVANAYGLTACSIPLPQMQGKLPIGIDVAASAGGDRQCLGLACVIEAALAR